MRSRISIGGLDSRCRFGAGFKVLRRMRSFRYESDARIRRALWHLARRRIVVDGHAPAPSYDTESTIARILHWHPERRVEMGVRYIYTVKGVEPHLDESVRRGVAVGSADARHAPYDGRVPPEVALRPRCSVCPSFMIAWDPYYQWFNKNADRAAYERRCETLGAYRGDDTMCMRCRRRYRTDDPLTAAMLILKRGAA